MAHQLSLCMIVKNEERSLPRCLDSVRGLADELIVVDTGSTDATPRIAESLGAQVSSFDFTVPDFAAARNQAISRATRRWILMLDADETLDPLSRPLVKTLVSLDLNRGYFFERRNYSAESAIPVTDYVVRLFPNNPRYRFRGRVHETIDQSIVSAGGRLQRSGIRIDHDFASDPGDRTRRNLWYISILQEEIAADPADLTRLDFLAAEYHQLRMFDQAAEVMERIARLRPTDHQAHMFAGVYHLLYQSDPVRARDDFQKVLSLRPGYPEAESFLRLIEAPIQPSG